MHPRIGQVPALLVLLCAVPLCVRAQSAFVPPGARVRLPGIGQAIVSARTPDTLYLLAKSGAAVAVPTAEVPVIELQGEKNRGAGAVRGAVIGGGIGLALGVAAWAAGDSTACRGFSGFQEYDCQRKYNAGDVALTGIGGGMIGAAIGALVGRREWHTVRISGPTSAHLDVLPGRRTVIAVRLSAGPPFRD